jgi:hypothetical protein
MAKKIAQHMTRIVAIGKLKSYEYTTEGFKMGKGQLDVGGGQTANFVLFNKDKEGVQNPHTKAADFAELYKEGDMIFLTGSDNRNYSEAKDTYFEGIQGWDYRAASEDEQSRYVFVYVGDVKELDEENLVLSFINYKDEETEFPINISKAKDKMAEGIEVGARVKIKGEIFNGMKLDYYGDGEFTTDRNAVQVELLNTAAEIEEDKADTPDEEGMWD